jgi:predicted nucleic-acid-binding protein
MRAVDTNVVIRLVTGDDPAQMVLAESFIANGAWVPFLVLAEAIWVLHTVFRKAQKNKPQRFRCC